jgi:hypothetical protein
MASTGSAEKMRDESEDKNTGHDPRLIDLAAVLMLLAVVATAYAVIALDRPTPKLTSRIVPSQSVRW